MSDANDGGPDFPVIRWKAPDGMCFSSGSHGLSMRDYFAAAALTGFLASRVNPVDTKAAEWAYGAADAMIRHRATAASLQPPIDLFKIGSAVAAEEMALALSACLDCAKSITPEQTATFNRASDALSAWRKTMGEAS